MDNTIIFGQDIGMGANKIYGPAGGLELPSQVSTDGGQRIGHLLGMRKSKPPMHITVNGISFYVGSRAHDWGGAVENLDYDRMTGVPETRAIVYGNLSQYMQQYGKLAQPLQMIVGLPLETLRGPNSSVNTAAVRQWLKGEHTWEADGQTYQVEIAEVKVTSQPSAALFDYMLDDQGKVIAERSKYFKAELGIISVGFNTIELLSAKGLSIVPGHTRAKTEGVRRLLELLNSDDLYTLGELDSMLRTRSLNVKDVLPVWERKVKGYIEKVWKGNWRHFARIIAVGGGAVLLKESLIQYFEGKLFVPEQPVLAISRGLYKQGLSLRARRKK